MHAIYGNVVGFKSQKIILCFINKLAPVYQTSSRLLYFSTGTCFCIRSQMKVLIEQQGFLKCHHIKICCHMKTNINTFLSLNVRDGTLELAVAIMNCFPNYSRKLNFDSKYIMQ